MGDDFAKFFLKKVEDIRCSTSGAPLPLFTTYHILSLSPVSEDELVKIIHVELHRNNVVWIHVRFDL